MDYHILLTLPLKIEVKNSGNKFNPKEEIAIGFVHDTVKNYFVVEAIKDEFKVMKTSKILSGKSII